MKKSFPFYKMQASGNDFVVVDNRKKAIRDPKKVTRALCERHTGIGSDGVLLIEPSRKADFKMRILNADGSEAEMCGNGSRCVALYANKVLGLPRRFWIETLAGVIGAEVRGDTVKVRLVDPKDFRPESILDVGGKKFRYYFINSGVPHTVIFVDDLTSFPVDEVGKKVRFHERFKPAGANANFVQVTGRQSVSVRTYERGVGETQACGTGVSASAIVSVLSKRCKPPVKVKTLGGEVLNIYFDHDKFDSRRGQAKKYCLSPSVKVNNVYLEGKAHFVFKGNFLPNSN